MIRSKRHRDWLKAFKAMPALPPSKEMSNGVRSGAGNMEIAPYGLGENMEAFDMLPRGLKRVLQQSAYNWSGRAVREMMARGTTAQQLMLGIPEVDRKKLDEVRREALKKINEDPH